MMITIKKALTDASFVKRGNTFFRVHGEGILQVIKPDKNAINFGLFSMYSRLLPQWFTPLGCIPRYSIGELMDQRCQCILSQAQYLLSDGLPWLESINTHKAMLDGLLLLETKNGRNVRWIDEQKIAPFLVCEDYTSAEKVICAILENHRIAKEINKTLYTSKADYQKYVERRTKDDEGLLRLLEMVHHRNKQEIRLYLMDNYTRNAQFANFCTCKDRN